MTPVARLSIMSLVLFVASCATSSWDRPLRTDCYDGNCQPTAAVCQHPTMMAVGHDLDFLERHIDQFGSVVAKQPDVWGEARLTRHREEFEKEMEKELSNFKDSVQGQLARSDQAFFANATALSAAISGQAAGVRPPRVMVNNTTQTQQSVQPEAISVPEATIEMGAFDAFSNIQRNPARLAAPLGFNEAYKKGISLEPVLFLDQKQRYLNHLHEIRRINEGDDTSDSPGYSLNLVRIPVSVLPGKKTDKGYGAEITMTMTPHLGEELLPATFRNLVVNDLVDHIGLPLVHVLNNEDPDDLEAVFNEDLSQPSQEDRWKRYMVSPAGQRALASSAISPPLTGSVSSENKQKVQSDLKAKYSAVIRSAIQKVAVSANRTRRARLPFPPSQAYDVYGEDYVMRIAGETYKAQKYQSELRHNLLHLPDVQAFLQEEINAAYRMLANESNQHLWAVCTPDLAAAVRSRHEAGIATYRTQFRNQLESRAGKKSKDTLTAALAWAILVDSALLNERLVLDMRETASAKGCPLPKEWLPYYLPCPPPEARMAFNEYVKCRWPIHVFALDPATQDQNIADSFSARREMQLALSLAFVSGNISARNMTRFARRLELEAETIALNRTVVGFAHGPDTFGWRFYPRFQTPDTESNATVLFRDLLYGGPSRDALLRQRALEPGPRECVAVVLMPSFVPYVTVDTTSNWFKLTNPKHKEFDHTETLKLSRVVRSIRNCATGIHDADCYREGELGRVMRRAEQLSARLPMQTLQVQAPIENTLGGFAMFNSGITDLTPELYGWYGEPGIWLDRDTTLFLVGDHFSVHQTRVVVGGLEVKTANRELLSRQVMKVTIPRGVAVLTEGRIPLVDVHVATPYGVTAHLEIPLIEVKKEAPATGLTWATPKIELGFVYSGRGIQGSSEPRFRPTALALKLLDTPLSSLAQADLTLTFAQPQKVTIKVSGIPYDPSTKQFVVADGKEDKNKILKKLIDDILDKYKDIFGPEQTNPPTPVEAKGVIEYKDQAGEPIGIPMEVTGSLGVNWIKAPN